MKRRILSLMLVFVLSIMLALPAYAAPGEGDDPDAPGAEALVYDEAGLLSGSEAAALEEQLQAISKAYDAQIVVITLKSVDGGDMDIFVEYIYDEMDLGYGENRDGALLLVSELDRKYRILTNGLAADAISTDDIEDIGDDISSDLTDENWADAFHTFGEKCEYYLDGHINGFPFEFGLNLAIALAIGLVVALIVTGIWRGQLKSVRKQDRAHIYVKPDSMHLTRSGDYFMYRNVTRTQRQSSSSSSSSGSSRNVGGGSF